ncbi:MAG: CHAT domain-containing protein [Richelia sp. RM2_1_2]|nr:CHAT domain-containing protein [Richelia sp. SM1_7_0]NJN10263.1 CHAT domain-containing protein [Richelia sp. RM1_1_1]NJO60647.1 CHAT domain-containing protein [Richelia sp. RM2_1_2]
MKKILILSANPKNTNQLRLDEEVREIKTALKLSKNREQFEIVTESALRVNDLRRSLLEHLPHIVHFSGHGAGSDGLALENKLGQMQLVSSESLAELFELFEELIECVVLNACYSEVQAESIYQHIDCVIGMNRAIGDIAAIEFATGFYDALAAGRSYRDAFEFGCGAIDLQGIPESKTPQIKARKNLYALTKETLDKSKITVESTAMTQPKYAESNSGISQGISGGTMYGGMIASQGSNNQQNMTNAQNINTPEQQQELVETANEIKILLQRLEQENPSKTHSQKMMVVAQAVEEIENNPTLKARVVGALKVAGRESFKESINHPLVNIFMAAIDGWL